MSETLEMLETLAEAYALIWDVNAGTLAPTVCEVTK